MAKKQPKFARLSRIWITLLMIFGGLTVIYPAAMHVFVWHLASSEAAEASPLMPQKLPDMSAADLKNGEDINAFGFSIRVPWKVLEREDVKTVVGLRLSNGASISILDEQQDPGVQGYLKDASGSGTATLKNMYGNSALNSKYEFLRDELNASPRDVSFWNSRAKNVKATMSLMSKAGLLRKATAIYPIKASHVRGFQIGEPKSGLVQLRIFDVQDRELWMVIHGPPKEVLTQSQVNGIVASIYRFQ